MSHPINHKPTCRRPHEYEVIGNQGDHLRRCRDCSAFIVVTPAPSADAETDALPVSTRYRCRVHQEEVVSSRGKGCTACKADTAAREAERGNRRERTREQARSRRANQLYNAPGAEFF